MKNVKPASGSLHERLKTAAWPAHARAHDLEFMLQIRKKRVTRKQYRVYLAQLYYVYTELERGLSANKTNDVISQMYFPDELGRQEALESDLCYFYGADWRDEITCLDATRRFVLHLRLLSKVRPALLVCHAYVRYMGDLSGGQLMIPLLETALSIPRDTALHFNRFTHVSDRDAFMTLYYDRLNSLEVTEDTKVLMEEETTLSFELNVAMVEDVGRYVCDKLGGYHSDVNDDVRENKVNSMRTLFVIGIPTCLALAAMGRIVMKTLTVQ